MDIRRALPARRLPTSEGVWAAAIARDAWGKSSRQFEAKNRFCDCLRLVASLRQCTMDRGASLGLMLLCARCLAVSRPPRPFASASSSQRGALGAAHLQRGVREQRERHGLASRTMVFAMGSRHVGGAHSARRPSRHDTALDLRIMRHACDTQAPLAIGRRLGVYRSPASCCQGCPCRSHGKHRVGPTPGCAKQFGAAALAHNMPCRHGQASWSQSRASESLCR